MTNPISLEQIRKKFDLCNDNGHDHTLTNLDVQTILSSEQAWKSEAERLQLQLDRKTERNHELYQDSLQKWNREEAEYYRIQEQLNQAIEVLEHYGKDPVNGNHARFVLQQMGLEATVSSLSGGNHEKR